MSLILDALKKLEREKIARKDEHLNVAAEILQPERLQHRNKKRTMLLIIAAVSTALAAIAVLGLREGTNILNQSSLPTSAAPPTLSRTAMPLPAPIAVPAKKPEEPTVARSRSDIGKGRIVPPPAVSLPRPAKYPANKGIAAPENSSPDSAPRLRVEGIVWQEERSERRAFVNGIIASEGSVIDGARVVEIYPARVRFSRGGESYDISMEKAP